MQLPSLIRWLAALSLIVSTTSVLAVDKHRLEQQFGYDTNTQYEVPPDELMHGCPRVDCIPAIDKPEFTDAAGADFLNADDLVLALELAGEARAYPIVILDRHEIVNDQFGRLPVAITWCPLCGSGLVFQRRVGNKVLDFGVSGYLHNSDLVMYDRQTNSLWGQISGSAIAGPLAGEELPRIQATITEWQTWRTAHPDTQVLSTDTGHGFRYQGSAYGDYQSSDTLMFPVKIREFGIHPKTVVFGLTHNGQAVAVTADHLKQNGPVITQLGDTSVEINLTEDGTASATETQSGHSINTTRLFWFGWLNFNPETQLIPEP